MMGDWRTRLTVELVPSTCWYTNAPGGPAPPGANP